MKELPVNWLLAFLCYFYCCWTLQEVEGSTVATTGKEVEIGNFFDGDIVPNWTSLLLSVPRGYLAAASVGSKVMFAGGWSGIPTDEVDIYHVHNNTWNTASLCQPRAYLTGVTVGSKILFAGGSYTSDDNVSHVVDIYEDTNSTWTCSELSVARFFIAGTVVGNKAFFGGGLSGFSGTTYDVVDIYDSSLNMWFTDKLSEARCFLAATSTETKAIFAGGYTGRSHSATVDIYDVQSKTWQIARLSVARDNLAATSVGTLVLIAGGWNDSVVDLFDTSTGNWSVQHLSEARGYLAAATVGSRAIFAGGLNGAFTRWHSTVDIYDTHQKQWSVSHLEQERSDLASTVIGNKAMFAGGCTIISCAHNGYSSIVDVLEFTKEHSSWIYFEYGAFGLILVLAIVIIVFVLVRKRSSAEHIPLPPQIAWSFIYVRDKGKEKVFFKICKITPSDVLYKRVHDLFYGSLNGGDIQLKKVYAVYPEHLLKAFLIFKRNIEIRMNSSPSLFKQSWSEIDPLRLHVLMRFDELVRSFDWNGEEPVKIIPQVHGTDFKTALEICKTGFASLALLDKGWYGKGIYFSSHALYIIPYFATKKKPTIIISYVIPGHPYLVTEHPIGQGSLLGTALKGTSHYILTTGEGFPISLGSISSSDSKMIYDELVIPQEAQILPGFLLQVSRVNLSELIRTYDRRVYGNEGDVSGPYTEE